MKLSVVIAAYDEVTNVTPLYRRLQSALASMDGVRWELVFVVEGTDGTRERLEELSSGADHVEILYQEEPSGLGAAFRRGFAAVADDADVVVTLDADLNHRPEEIPRLLDALLDTGSDIVVGSRFVAGSQVDGTPVWKRVLSGTINWSMGWFYGLAISDKSSGFRLYRADALRRIRYTNDRFGFLPEILIRAARMKLKIVEQPIHFTFREHGESKMAFVATSWSYLQLFFSSARDPSAEAAESRSRLRVRRHAGLVAVLVVAAALRVIGLGWSLPSEDYRHQPFHPDETWAMRNFAKLDPTSGALAPGAGLREGTLYYYVWLGSVEAARLIGWVDSHSWEVKKASHEDFPKILLIGRMLNVGFELATTTLIYLSVLVISRRRLVAIFAATVFAVLPFEIIYSQFTRTQAIANAFIAAVIYLSVQLPETVARRRTLFLIGLVAGLGTAARWTTAYVLVIPAILLAGWAWNRSSQLVGSAGHRIRALAKESCAVFAIPGFILALAVGNPIYLLAPAGVKKHLSVQMQYADGEQFFSPSSLLDLEKLWMKVTYLIPYGTLPLLWLILYAGAVMAWARKDRLRFVLPLFFFGASYLYIISKAYKPDSFVREAMPSFPVLAMLAALGLEKALEMTRGRRFLRGAAQGLAAAAVLGAAVFSFDYVWSMSQPDPRVSAHRFIESSAELRQQVVAIYPSPKNYFIADPAFEDLPASLKIETRECSTDFGDVAVGEFLLLADFRSLDVLPRIERAREQLLGSGDFRLVAEFDNTPGTLAWAHRVIGPAPHDMQYPFPVLYLFQRLAASSGVAPLDNFYGESRPQTGGCDFDADGCSGISSDGFESGDISNWNHSVP